MPHVLITAMALALLASAHAIAADDPIGAPAGDYVLDGRAASLEIKLSPRVAGYPPPVLRLTKLEGRVRYEPDRWEAANVTISADPRSIETSRGLVGRRARALFQPDKFPIIKFTSTSLRWLEDDRGEAVGELTFHGVTRPLVLSVVLREASRSGPNSEARLRFTGRGRLKRSDFGVTEGMLFIGDAVDLAFDLDFVQQPASDAQP